MSSANNSNLQDNKPIKEVLTGGLSPTLQEVSQDLAKERNKVQKSTSEKVNDTFSNIENEPISSKSTIYRASEQAGYNAGLSDRAVQEKNIIMPGFKDKENNNK